jgi:hypothetical protein
MNKTRFTFIEVLIASLILAFSAVALVEMTSRAHLQTYDIEAEWAEEHLLSLSCEYFLLFGHDADIPEDLLPDGFSAECELNSAIIPEEADEEKYDPINGWVLGELTITLIKDGTELTSISIDKMLPEDAFQ